LVGPIFFFSDLGGFVVENPVESAFVGLSFIINKNMTESEFMGNTATSATPQNMSGTLLT
jgi:hypothetical protein